MERVMSATVTISGEKPKSFDAILYKPTAAEANAHRAWRLWIILRVTLQQVNPDLPYSSTAEDADHTPFWIDRWTPPEWEAFKRAAEQQARLWHEKFLLKPPPTFTEGDIRHVGGRASVWRPYIDCWFSVSFSDRAAAHTTVKVAKLNVADVTRRAKREGIEGVIDSPDGGTFRSNAALWDSFDLVPKLTFGYDWDGHINAGYKAPSVAHEIGHALGLPHIGELRSAPLCQLAMRLGWSPTVDDLKSRLFVGGSNSSVCYGNWYVDGSLEEDIMGGGATFSAVDGLPWVWAMQQLRRRPQESWQVLLRNEGSETGSYVLK